MKDTSNKDPLDMCLKKCATGGEAVLVFESNIEMMNTWAVFGKARVR